MFVLLWIYVPWCSQLCRRFGGSLSDLGRRISLNQLDHPEQRSTKFTRNFRTPKHQKRTNLPKQTIVQLVTLFNIGNSYTCSQHGHVHTLAPISTCLPRGTQVKYFLNRVLIRCKQNSWFSFTVMLKQQNVTVWYITVRSRSGHDQLTVSSRSVHDQLTISSR